MSRYRRQAMLSAITLAVSLVTGPMRSAAEDTSFFEPFDRLTKDRWFISSGWTNGDHQSCLWHRDRVAVEDGKLLLSLTADAKDGHDLSCAEIQSRTRFGYGTYEARMKVPYARGMNANLFTFIGAPQDRPHNEIDFEFIAPRGPTLQTNFHTANNSKNEGFLEMADDGVFRSYAFIWEPERIRWYIDGALIRDQRGGVLPDDPQKIYLSLWSTETLVEWMGAFDPESAPQTLVVDWLAYTELGSSCTFEGSVLCQDGVDVSQ
ncbi:family 16 glycosylhydrolase [uncultured Roseobacter sp.]|uniref:family 16 glycosylhydrolase n=1 Tax=uncultured Roseobacter sp. TaxID=114847 RepID=UPI002626DD7C|nr:family 16 glycosylhydrolase [uncultured Roseobacter sp.]